VKRLVLSCVLVSCLVQAQQTSWNRIDILCVIRDAQGRPVTNLTRNRLQVLGAGEPRVIFEFSRPRDQPQIETVANGPNLYPDAYLAINRKFTDSNRRKILVIEDRAAAADTLTVVRRWELIFMAERLGVVIYVVRGRACTALAALAEETGGRVVQSERDVQADLAAQYRIVAQAPPHDRIAGAYQTLEVRVATPGLRVQAPHNFYITPPWEALGTGPLI
jgi:hypothetical protein